MAGGLGIAMYSLYRQSTMGLNGLGFLTLPYEYAPSAPSYSYNEPSYSRPMYNEYSNRYPVSFTSDNNSPFETPSFSSKMSDEAFINMVRQISETDGVAVIENATTLNSQPSIAAGVPIRVLGVVKSQVENAMSSSRLTADQKGYLTGVSGLISMRIVALTPQGPAEAMSGIF